MLDYKIYLKEIISMIEKVESSTSGITFDNFEKNSDLFDATLMRIHFIGETIKSIPYSLKKKHKEIRWRSFERLRNIISHKYSNVNKNIIWDVVQKLPELKEQIKAMLERGQNII